MATFTSRLGLRKPADTDQVNVITDLGENFDKIDARVGFTIGTSTARPSAPYTGQALYETDTGNHVVWDGTAWRHFSIPVVPSTASIAAPYNGQLVFVTSDNMVYRYVTNTWVACIATGGTLHEARYSASAVQSIPNVVDTKILFGVAAAVSSDVSPYPTPDGFVLNRAGLWQITAGVRLVAGTAGERHLFLSTGTNPSDLAARLAGSSAQGGSGISLSVSTEGRFASGTSIIAGVYQSSGAARNTEPNGSAVHISLTWLRP